MGGAGCCSLLCSETIKWTVISPGCLHVSFHLHLKSRRTQVTEHDNNVLFVVTFSEELNPVAFSKSIAKIMVEQYNYNWVILVAFTIEQV